MKLFGRWYILSLKAQLKRAEGYFAILLMIFVTLVFSHLQLPQKNNTAVGIYCEDQALAMELLTILETQNSIYQFTLETSEIQLKQKVLSSELECGFKLEADYKESFAKGNQREVVTYYCSGLTSKGEVAKETVYLALFKVQSASFIKANMDKIYKAPSEEVYETISNYENSYLNGTELFSVREEYVGEPAAVEMKKEGKTYPVWGSNLFILFLLIFFVRGDILAKERTGYPLILRRGERFLFCVARCLAAATGPAVVCLILGECFGEPLNGFLLLIFLAYSILWCQLLAMLLKKESRYYASFLAVMVLLIVLSPVYFDLSMLFPVAKILKVFTPVGVILW